MEYDERPFYWVKPYADNCAPTGWYQWTKRGLVYLGPTILAADADQSRNAGIDMLPEEL